MYKFDFAYAEYESFIERCGFSDDELIVIEMKRKGKSIVQIADVLHVSERTVNRRVKSIAKKILREL